MNRDETKENLRRVYRRPETTRRTPPGACQGAAKAGRKKRIPGCGKRLLNPTKKPHEQKLLKLSEEKARSKKKRRTTGKNRRAGGTEKT